MRSANDNRLPLTPQKDAILKSLLAPPDMTEQNWKNFAAELRRQNLRVVPTEAPQSHPL